MVHVNVSSAGLGGRSNKPDNSPPSSSGDQQSEGRPFNRGRDQGDHYFEGRHHNEHDRDQGVNHDGGRHHRSGNNRLFYSLEERKTNGFCIHWNRGFCQFEDRCMFLHVESPNCYFQDKCRRKMAGCKYFHWDVVRDEHFLDKRRFSYNQA